MTKPFHAGRACESGVLAAELAQLGFTATPIVLEAGRGFSRRRRRGSTRGRSKASSATRGRSPSRRIDQTAPDGSLTHPGWVALELILEPDIKPGQVGARVGRRQPPKVNALIHNRRETELQAKFSMPF